MKHASELLTNISQPVIEREYEDREADGSLPQTGLFANLFCHLIIS